eukprot:GHRR01017626.1.p1 GENE.GHRR01017626.1~~GHRR01017626.1.p1  ORF type:complete len:132 (-),score=30.19 GHRR01017626.1:1596-1991(-)
MVGNASCGSCSGSCFTMQQRTSGTSSQTSSRKLDGNPACIQLPLASIAAHKDGFQTWVGSNHIPCELCDQASKSQILALQQTPKKGPIDSLNSCPSHSKTLAAKGQHRHTGARTHNQPKGAIFTAQQQCYM